MAGVTVTKRERAWMRDAIRLAATRMYGYCPLGGCIYHDWEDVMRVRRPSV